MLASIADSACATHVNLKKLMPFYAHSLENQPREKWETMQEHEERVASLCAEFLGRIHPDLAPWGELLGRWHDLGKYHPEFQAKLRGKKVQIEHAGAGAMLALENAVQFGIPLAFAIAGHHAGLANLNSNDPTYGPIKRSFLSQRIQTYRAVYEIVKNHIPSSVSNLEVPEFPDWIEDRDQIVTKRRTEFLTRVMFSALIDADRLATSKFYSNAEGILPDHETLEYDCLELLRERLDHHIDQLAPHPSYGLTPVNQFRAKVLESCRNAFDLDTGLFSLTVPTGGGKTLSAMSFALRHAIKKKLDRVIVVIPYTSIIRQNAEAYRKALGKNGFPDLLNVVEHHTGIDEHKAFSDSRETKEAEIKRRIAVENWDAPIIVTTSVQFFESLFTDHPSKARKLHRIAKSVVILDEVQTLPPGLLHPILDGIRELTSNYRTSVVLSTATPSAIQERVDFPFGLENVRAIINDPETLAKSKAAQRVNVKWRIDQITTYGQLAEELKQCDPQQSLTVVHRRKDARALAELLPKKKRIHLSAQMCPAHRIAVIDEINRRLSSGEDCLIVATQLIEAGVNLDLPIVFRALAGVDSLTQAAGRCDREGERTIAFGKPAGQFTIFLAETSPPGVTLQTAMSATQSLFNQKREEGEELDIFNPHHCIEFFQKLYGLTPLDDRNIQREREGFNFANVGKAFEMIENSWSFPVVVPWPMSGENAGEGMRRAEKFSESPSRDTNRALQPFTVQVPKPAAFEMERQGIVEIWDESIGLPFHTFDKNWYSEEFGILVEDKMISPECLIE